MQRLLSIIGLVTDTVSVMWPMRPDS